jgi:hypothetical protein
VAQQATAPARSSTHGIVEQLAKFFPQATPLRLAVRVTQPGSDWLGEGAVIEFGTAREVLFALFQPLEFGDRVRMQNSDGSLDVEATVVAVQYHDGRTAVAARFTSAVTNWIVNP